MLAADIEKPVKALNRSCRPIEEHFQSDPGARIHLSMAHASERNFLPSPLSVVQNLELLMAAAPKFRRIARNSAFSGDSII